jgi:hypothetical protein
VPILGRGQPIRPHILGNSLVVAAGLASATGVADAGAYSDTYSDVYGGYGISAIGLSVAPVTASATGTAPVTSAIGITITAGLASATGAGYALAVNTTGITGLASGTGSALSPPSKIGALPGLPPGGYSGTAAGENPTSGITITAGLASATGSGENPTSGITITAGLASATGTGYAVAYTSPGAGTGTAYNASAVIAAKPPAATATASVATMYFVTAGVASATGAAYIPNQSLSVYDQTGALAVGDFPDPQVTPGIGIAAGLASGTGQALPTPAELASAAASAYNATPVVSAEPTAAAGIGTAYAATVADKVVTPQTATAAASGINPVYGLQANAVAAAESPTSGITITAGLASATGAAQEPATTVLVIIAHAALAIGTAENTTPPAQAPAATASAFNATTVLFRAPQNLGATVTPVLIDGGAISLAANYGGAISLAANYGGGAVPVTVDAVCTPVTYDGSCSSLANTYGGTVGVTDFADGTLVGWTMQNVGLTLAENNDESINIAITQNGVALSLSGATINMYFKTAAGTADGSALLFSSAGGSPAITITNSSGGLATAAIPHADLEAETYNFYRIDVVFSGLQNTCIYGNITWITL